ncbi:hypothetical protein O181_052429 [Austropuccinia psidii MF-1]|uniref:Uncharacterized protein n=1 Tax=Austropuccinia psidii MF-1 TaxID=1389203 RepID=A0A9Q3E0P1_9BASI|nr:hypothetical protein [Austropuccinia psidii MF-1]
MLPQIHQGVMNSWNVLKLLLKEEEIVKYSNGWNALLSKTQIKNIKEWHNKKREARKEEVPVISTSKPQVNLPPQEGKKKKKKNWMKPYSPRIQKDAMGNVFKVSRTLMEFKEKEEKRMR